VTSEVSELPRKGGLGRGRFARRSLSDKRLAFVLVFPTAAMLLAFEVFPFAVASFDSFRTSNQLNGGPLQWVGLQNFITVLTARETHDAFVLSLLYVTGSVLIQATLGVITALVLNGDLKGQTLARGFSILPFTVPAIVTALSFRFSLNDLYGIVNYVLVTLKLVQNPIPFLTDPHTILWVVIGISSWRHAPFFTILVLARLQTLPRDRVEAASLDGAGAISTFRHITLPWIMPVLLIAMLLRTIWSGVEFDTPYLIAYGGPLNASTVVPIQIYNLYTQQSEVGEASALSLCVAVVLLIASIAYLRLYRRAEDS